MPIKNSTKSAIKNSLILVNRKKEATKEYYKKYGKNLTFSTKDELRRKFEILCYMSRLPKKKLFEKLVNEKFNTLTLSQQKAAEELAQTILEFENPTHKEKLQSEPQKELEFNPEKGLESDEGV